MNLEGDGLSSYLCGLKFTAVSLDTLKIILQVIRYLKLPQQCF